MLMPWLTSVIAGLLMAEDPKGPPPAPAPVYCRVEGRPMILKVLEEGAKVRKGDTVCELDASGLRDRLVDQRLALIQTEEALRTAAEKRVAADAALELARAKAAEGIRLAAEKVALARSDMERAKGRLDGAKAQEDASRTKGAAGGNPQIRDDQAAFEKAKILFETLNSKAQIAEQLAKDRPKLKEEIVAIQARAEERIGQAQHEAAEARVKHSESQILDSTILAPADGTLRLANPKGSRSGEALIQEGATLRERQKIFTIEPK